ncbi:sugar nucleotide-binding protein [uncultured Streptomyces sp.]|uniref:SDR family oxidoreductase n=1 Tax=uncultured Streptomyces sp. TaxID=174707 RepID=UPI00260A9C52|nr:sugar nucleotide-binding protein [uncultured Streptomyces sp.]
MKVLIVGGSGFLGSELVRRATALGHPTAATWATRPPGGGTGQDTGGSPTATGATWYPLDLRDPGRIEDVLAASDPHVIVNATSGGSDWPVTAEGPVRLAMAAAEHGSRLVHVSSDAVFSGARVHYDESCPPDPLTPYGAAKAAAETGIGCVYPRAVVARTSLIIGDRRSHHVRLVHDLAAGARDGALFTDDVRCPVHVADLARALLELAFSDAGGVRHLAGDDAVSRYELGLLVARRDGLDASRLTPALRAGSACPGALDVRLDCRATLRELSVPLRGARRFLPAGP